MPLVALHREIHRRTGEIASSQPDWPCRKGCDLCCRRLASLPELTQAEWTLLERGLAMLPPDTQAQIRDRVDDLRTTTAPYTCPFLDQPSGSCSIYEHRPVACRTYGFYVERDRGLYCRSIEALVDDGTYRDVVWGNSTGVDAALDSLGPKSGLFDHFKATGS